MSQLFAMAVPIIKGKEAEWQKFADELNGKWKEEFIASRKKLGVRERTFIQRTPMGDFVLVTLEGDDPQSVFQKLSAENDEFTRWFLEKAKTIHGLDLSRPPEGPMPELVVDTGAL